MGLERHLCVLSQSSHSKPWLDCIYYFNVDIFPESLLNSTRSLLGHVCSVASIMSDPLWPHGLQPTRLLYPWDSWGKNTEVGCHALLQDAFPIQGSNSRMPSPSRGQTPGCLPHPGVKPMSTASPPLQADSLPTELPRKILFRIASW